MTFNPITSPVDHIVLAGRRSPGVATLEGVDTPRHFQERRGFGISFATLRFRGVGLAHFKCVLKLTSEQDWTDWHAWKDLVARPSTETNPSRTASVATRLTAPPMAIEHPILADLGIADVVVENVEAPIQTDHGEWTITIHFGEYRPPVFALETTEGSVARQSDNIENQHEALSRTIEELAGQANRLARE